METRKKTSTPRMDRKGLILTVVGALLVIAIIVIAVVLMQRSGGDVYGDNRRGKAGLRGGPHGRGRADYRTQLRRPGRL